MGIITKEGRGGAAPPLLYWRSGSNCIHRGGAMEEPKKK